jgi:hypothetical protein
MSVLSCLFPPGGGVEIIRFYKLRREDHLETAPHFIDGCEDWWKGMTRTRR